LLLAILGFSLLAAIAAGGLTSWWLEYTSAEQRRIRSMTAAAASYSGVIQTPAAKSLVDERLDPVLERLSRFAPKSAKDMGRLQQRLTKAGYPSRQAAVVFSATQVLAPIVLGLITFLLLGSSNMIFVMLAAAFGYVMPGFYIGRRITLRQKAIVNGLPDGLDLLTVCVEAGSGLDQAISKASEELELAHPALAWEFRMITTETRAGKPRLEAFQNFARRTGVEDVRSLVNMLTQTDRFGTSIGQALRSHAETIRTKRRQNAEERAGKIGVKLVFPLALCLFPALYIVCFGAVVIRIIHAFF
jgi:tight adherence protein C